MSIRQEALRDVTEQALLEPSTTPVEAAIDPATLSLILDIIMRGISTLCGGATATQTAQAIKSPTTVQRWQLRRQCEEAATSEVGDQGLDELELELEDGRPEGMSRRDWRTKRSTLRSQIRDRRRRLKSQRDEYARRAYYGLRKSVEKQSVERVAAAVEEYRAEEGMVVS